MPKNDGGPAFPVTDRSRSHYPGMSLRQWYAGMALQGLIAVPETLLAIYDQSKLDREDMDVTMAKAALGMADAMLAQEAEDET